MTNPDQALFEAGDDVDAVKAALAAGADPNARDEDEDSPLLLVDPGSEAFATLLAAGADINVSNTDGHSVFIRQAAMGAVERLSELVASGANPALADSTGYTALHWAAQEGHSDTLSTLLTMPALPVDAETDGGVSPLTIASSKGDLDSMKVLVEGGAAPTHASKAGWTPLMVASRGGHLHAVEFLLDAGAELEARDADGWNALMSAAVSGNSELVSLLLKRGGDVTARNNDGWSALLFALDADIPHDDKVKTVSLLLAGGSVPNPREALAIAILHADKAGIEAAIKAGADVNADLLGEGITPLRVCATEANRKGVTEVAGVLLNAGAEADLADLGRACYAGVEDFVRLFAGAGLNLDERDEDGELPIECAMEAENAEAIVAVLLEAGATPTASYWIWLGEGHFRAERFDESAKAFSQIREDERTDSTWSNLGYCYQRMGDHEASINAFEKAIDKAPDKGHACAALCYSAFEAERWEMMLWYAEKAVELQPKNDYAWQQVGIAHQQLSQMEAAEDAYRKASELNPKNAYSRLNLATLVWDVRQEVLTEEIAQALKLVPELDSSLDDQDVPGLREAFEKSQSRS